VALYDADPFVSQQGAIRARLSRMVTPPKVESYGTPNFKRSGQSNGTLGVTPVAQQPFVMGRGTATGDGSFEAFVNSIAKQESGNNYGARGIQTRSGRALGKYQILDTNIPSWSKAALGRSISPDEFLRSPQLQEQVARYKLQDYFKKYGAEGAAKAWYGGEGAARKSSNNKNNGGKFPSLNSYAQSVVGRMR
jgi:hypothetical protein